jgi:2-oxo-4-hydroxy-4-carboxy-5-ureidoimidazoline decarboxylase
MAELHALLNGLEGPARAAAFARCCGARRWVEGMLALAPFASHGAVLAGAERVWAGLGPDDLREAFAHHPQIGGDLAALRARFPSTAAWSGGEQAGVAAADDAVLQALAAGNARYLARFGYIFIVCATGKSAAEMLALLESRLANPPERELAIAAAEQAGITRLRLEKLAADAP